MPWTDPDLNDWAVGQAVTASDMDTYVKDNLSWLGTDRPHARAVDSSFSHNSPGNWLSPSWSTISTNVASMVAAGGGSVTATTAGFYIIGGGATFTTNTTGARGLILSSSANGGGTVYAQQNVPNQSVDVGATIVTALYCTGSQAIHIAAYQGSGGTLTLTNVHMWAIWVTT